MKKITRLLLATLLIGAAIGAKLAWECFYSAPDVSAASHAAERFLPSSLRGVLADVAWLEVTQAWQERDWPHVEARALRALRLRPEEPLFFELAGWHLAWNAALDLEEGAGRSAPADRQATIAYYIGAGRQVFTEGIALHPNHWPLYQLLAMLEGQRASDWSAAAGWYERGSHVPGAPAFLQRLAADAHERAGEWKQAAALWKASLEICRDPHQRAQCKRRLEHAYRLVDNRA